MWNADGDPFANSAASEEPLFPADPFGNDSTDGTEQAAPDNPPATPDAPETAPRPLMQHWDKGRPMPTPALPPVDYGAHAASQINPASAEPAGGAPIALRAAAAPRSRLGGARHAGYTHDPRFAVVTDLMQHGAWPQALEKLRALQADYPQATNLAALVDEAALKAELMEAWAHRIKGRRLTVGQAWLLRRSLPFVLLLTLFVGIALFYQSFVAPSRQVVALEQANQAQVKEALGLIQVGDFTLAMGLLEEVLARDPENVDARQGLESARTQLGLTVNYDIALEVAQAGNLPRAIAILQSIKGKSPSFRDVDAQISRLTKQAEVQDTLAAAERAFSQRRWLEATQRYELVAALQSDYEAELVQARLNQAYFNAGMELATSWPRQGAGPEEARSYLRKAQLSGAQRTQANDAIERLDVYLAGAKAAERKELSAAINYWRGLYDRDPGYLGGYLAEQLYRVYLDLGAQVAGDGKLDYARELYQLAADLQVADPSEANRRLGALAAAPTPTPTPLPQPTAFPVFIAPVATAAPPAPTPTPTPANTYVGWIAFRSTRDGGEAIYIMRPDGSDQQRAPQEIASQIDAIYAQGRLSPDGAREVYVQTAPDRSDANVFVTHGPGQSPTMLTNETGDEYDPRWSPNGEWITYVGNSTGNDEIYLVRPDGSDKRQLTWNEWPWDKHPSWSPDSSQIAFFSNRSGKRQIWIMSYDGTNQRNISNNGYEDWDPVWLK